MTNVHDVYVAGVGFKLPTPGWQIWSTADCGCISCKAWLQFCLVKYKFLHYQRFKNKYNKFQTKLGAIWIRANTKLDVAYHYNVCCPYRLTVLPRLRVSLGSTVGKVDVRYCYAVSPHLHGFESHIQQNVYHKTKNLDTRQNCCNHPKIWTKWL